MATLVDLPLSGPNGSTTFTDSTGREWTRPATSGNNAQIQDNALFLDGNGDYITTPATPELTFGSRQFRFEFEMKTSQAAGSEMTILDYDSNQAYGWLLLQRSGSGRIGLWWPGYGYVLTSVNSLNDGLWHSVVFESANGRLRFFIDGVAEPDVALPANAFTSGSVRLSIGYGVNTALPYFNGSIRNVKVTAPDPAAALTRTFIRRAYIGWDNVKSFKSVRNIHVYQIPNGSVRKVQPVKVTRGVPPWWGPAGSTTQLPTYKLKGRVMQRDPETLEDTPVQNVRVALFFRRLHLLVDIQLSDADGYVQFDNLMPGVQAYYGIAIDSDNAPLQNSILWDRLSPEPGP